jgi:chemotaxis signal transduction protein
MSLPAADRVEGEGLYVVARVGDERFAFPVGQVEEAVDAPEIELVPAMPEGMLGQLAHRGRRLVAWHAGWAFRLGIADGAAPTRVALVLRDGPRRVALVVDDVLAMARIDPADLLAVPEGADVDGVLGGVCLLAERGDALVNVVRVDVLAAILAPQGTMIGGMTS